MNSTHSVARTRDIENFDAKLTRFNSYFNNGLRYRIGPFEVESVLLEHPSVAESAVVASPDDLRGQIVKAFIVPTSQYADRARQEAEREALIGELQDFVKGRTAPYKYPRDIEFVDSLPKTVSGKIMRNVLRRREMSEEQRQGG